MAFNLNDFYVKILLHVDLNYGFYKCNLGRVLKFKNSNYSMRLGQSAWCGIITSWSTFSLIVGRVLCIKLLPFNVKLNLVSQFHVIQWNMSIRTRGGHRSNTGHLSLLGWKGRILCPGWGERAVYSKMNLFTWTLGHVISFVERQRTGEHHDAWRKSAQNLAWNQINYRSGWDKSGAPVCPVRASSGHTQPPLYPVTCQRWGRPPSIFIMQSAEEFIIWMIKDGVIG